MEHIYADIAARTGGNIYVGVVGPVRTGKSTLIKRIMEELVIPGIDDPYRKERARDELPQSGSGRTIMTSEPKFVPEEAVEVCPDGATRLRVRMIDSVGYMVEGAVGAQEDGEPRMVTTPWFDHEIPMTQAAELGTKKVMEEHCTIGLVVTTDGTITDIPRQDYAEAEMEPEHPVKAELYQALLRQAGQIANLGQAAQALEPLGQLEQVQEVTLRDVDLGQGVVRCAIALPDALYYEILSAKAGLTIENDAQLLALLMELARVKQEYDKIADALSAVKATGYGVVMPTAGEMRLETPEILRKGSAFGVKLKAGAPSIHMIRVDIDTEISPMVGDEKQSRDLITHLTGEDPQQLWQSNIFGKSVYDLIQEGLTAKLVQMPEAVREKFRGTLTRIVNDGASGLICLIL